MIDPRIPLLRDSALRSLDYRIKNLQNAQLRLSALLAEELTPDDVDRVYEWVVADLPCPLRATLVDLGRVLRGTLPTEDIDEAYLRLVQPAG